MPMVVSIFAGGRGAMVRHKVIDGVGGFREETRTYVLVH